ncbi:RNase H domain-containing protein [Caerostris extrusa]|uniref:RNase H domain-containing protein n=1 Tax=Caerostris extrusa TaxID=172846 RepID=A0AAV4T485_CAEEX|nr:RNase H domain-containing protein [Caerostris extrusa]
MRNLCILSYIREVSLLYTPLENNHPTHLWCLSERPGTSINFKGYRRDQTALARLPTGYLKIFRFFHGATKFPVCTKCSNEEAIPQHLTTCVNMVREDLLKRPIWSI